MLIMSHPTLLIVALMTHGDVQALHLVRTAFRNGFPQRINSLLVKCCLTVDLET